jgi:proteasome lid subunit RPN8/RPN11
MSASGLTLQPGILEDIVEDAKAAYPGEACGLIAGITQSSTGNRLIRMKNVARSQSEFEMDAGELVSTLRDMRNAGEELVAIYHSHPHGPLQPSRTDIARAYYPEAAHVIVSLAERERPRVAAFRIADGQAIEIDLHAIV